ncbi:hypothetical protein FMUND_184 [Fusarium mundagurra]|uniref:Uncharacterized protein n=1 Tax=Fusarium mundagurra TaxID=1567541 RepID=A0A8H5Z5B8_9HYPO|nr:hypothetical protein FMUND_184 [Fusarium mundagurra]
MKYSAIALLALAQGIVAIPSLLGQIKQSQSKVLVPDQDISLVSPSQIPKDVLYSNAQPATVPMHRDKPHTKQHDICWLLCASDEIKCPDGWYVDVALRGLKAMHVDLIVFQQRRLE